jgi:hypothetical protein
VQDLVLHEEYAGPLRQEIREHSPNEGEFPIDLEGLPLLDSFMKESIRCSNVDASKSHQRYAGKLVR